LDSSSHIPPKVSWEKPYALVTCPGDFDAFLIHRADLEQDGWRILRSDKHESKSGKISYVCVVTKLSEGDEKLREMEKSNGM